MYKIVSFNGFSINDGTNYSATFNGSSFLGSTDASPVYIKQMNSDSVPAGVYTVGQKQISITIETVAKTGRTSLINQLRYQLQRGTTGKLVVTFLDENVNYYVNATITSLQPTSVYDGIYIVTMTTADTSWIASTASTDTWSISAGTSATKSVTVGGSGATRLAISLTPTTNPEREGYFLYQNIYVIPCVPGKAFNNHPVCISLDTHTLITATKMQSTCNDLRVMIDGQEVERWITGANSATTKVWFNLTMNGFGGMTLFSSIASSGSISSILFNATASNKTILRNLPSSGYVYDNGEVFSYTGITSDVSCQLTGVTRAALGTSMASHSTNAQFLYVQHIVTMCYGNSTIGDPASSSSDYDAKMPVFNLTSSTNTSWVYDATTPYYGTGRPGSWIPQVSKASNDNVSNIYTYKHGASSGDYVLGMRIGSYMYNAKWNAANSRITWELVHPANIYQVTATTDRYKYAAAWVIYQLYSGAGLMKINSQGTISQVWNDSNPAVQTWTSATHAATTLNTSRMLFIFGDVFAAVYNGYACLEIQTCTVSFTAANCPSPTALGEKQNYTLNITIENTTNGDSINLIYPMLINTPIVIDSENYTITYNEKSAYAALQIDDAWRDVWIRLVPGTNALKISATNGFGAMTGSLSWYKRRV